MIEIAGQGFLKQGDLNTSDWPMLERQIFEQKLNSPVTYVYTSPQQVRFEMVMRARIVEAARALEASAAEFGTFEESRCNDAFWERTADGGFRLKAGASPSAAIRDIYKNGHLYAFECATAAVIVLYKGILDTIGEELFDKYFASLYLRDWQFDSDLRLLQDKQAKQTYPGDILYFKNPDFSPKTPEWQGENAIKLAEDTYFAHGIGIVGADQIIAKLNRHRKPGSAQSAYLMEDAFYPDFAHLAELAGVLGPRFPALPFSARIGHFVYR